MVILVIMGFVLVLSIQIYFFLKNRLYREIPVYTVLMAFALIYAISALTEWFFPTPADLAEYVFKSLSDFVFNAGLKR